MLSKTKNGLLDINPESFIYHSDPRTKGGQRLHQEQTQHHVLFHSFPCTVSEWNLLPATISSVPSFESFQSQLGYYILHNLKKNESQSAHAKSTLKGVNLSWHVRSAN